MLERFVPESRAPGQITLLAAPACTVAYLLPLGLLAQLAFHRELYLGLLLLAISPVIPLLAVRQLLRSNTPEQAARLVSIISLIRCLLATVGAVLLIAWVGGAPAASGTGSGRSMLSGWWVCRRILASMWMTTVVVADLLVSMLHQGREAARTLAETEEGDALHRKLDALGTSLRT